MKLCEYHKTGLPCADLDFNICTNESRHNIKVERTNEDIDLEVEDREYGFCDKHFERHFHICTVHDLDKNGEEYTFQRKFPCVSTGGHSYYSKEIEDENKNLKTIQM